MGSVVFPDAALKVFLTASPEERAARRYKQLIDKGMRATMAALLEDIRTRDQRDSERAIAPLKMCADAILLDTTRMSVSDAVDEVLVQYRSASRAHEALPGLVAFSTYPAANCGANPIGRKPK
jgi:cytidylate kinase